MAFKIVKRETEAKMTQNCAADDYELKKGELVLLAVETSKDNKPKWHVFCPTDAACVAAAEKLVASNKSDNKSDSKKNNKKNTYQFGDERLVTGTAVKEALQEVRDKFNKEIQRLNNRIQDLEKWEKQLRQKSDSKSNPVRTPAGADEDGNFVVPERCLGVTKAGKECQQTKNRLQENGYCGQHQDQAGEQQDKPEENNQPEPITSGADLLAL